MSLCPSVSLTYRMSLARAQVAGLFLFRVISPFVRGSNPHDPTKTLILPNKAQFKSI